jgi:hypothetical protein
VIGTQVQEAAYTRDRAEDFTLVRAEERTLVRAEVCTPVQVAACTPVLVADSTLAQGEVFTLDRAEVSTLDRAEECIPAQAAAFTRAQEEACILGLLLIHTCVIFHPCTSSFEFLRNGNSLYLQKLSVGTA